MLPHLCRRFALLRTHLHLVERRDLKHVQRASVPLVCNDELCQRRHTTRKDHQSQDGPSNQRLLLGWLAMMCVFLTRSHKPVTTASTLLVTVNFGFKTTY